AFFNRKDVPSGTVAEPLDTAWVEKGIAQVSRLFPGNPVGAELRELAVTVQPEFNWLRVRVPASPPNPGRAEWIQLGKQPHAHGLPILSERPLWPGLGGEGIIGIIAACSILGVWIYFGAKKLFLVDLEDMPALDRLGPHSQAKYWLIIGHP